MQCQMTVPTIWFTAYAYHRVQDVDIFKHNHAAEYPDSGTNILTELFAVLEYPKDCTKSSGFSRLPKDLGSEFIVSRWCKTHR